MLFRYVYLCTHACTHRYTYLRTNDIHQFYVRIYFPSKNRNWQYCVRGVSIKRIYVDFRIYFENRYPYLSFSYLSVSIMACPYLFCPVSIRIYPYLFLQFRYMSFAGPRESPSTCFVCQCLVLKPESQSTNM